MPDDVKNPNKPDGGEGSIHPPESQAQFRQPTFWYNEADRKASFEMEDKRWSRNEQLKDWIKLLVLVIVTLAWHLTVYFLEPGLR